MLREEKADAETKHVRNLLFTSQDLISVTIRIRASFLLFFHLFILLLTGVVGYNHYGCLHGTVFAFFIDGLGNEAAPAVSLYTLFLLRYSCKQPLLQAL